MDLLRCCFLSDCRCCLLLTMMTVMPLFDWLVMLLFVVVWLQ
jgi:hypothetical protein